MPDSGLGKNQYHGLWANLDASREDETMVNCVLVYFSVLSEGHGFMGIRCGFQQQMCTVCTQ